jgi:hypothetical protein
VAALATLPRLGLIQLGFGFGFAASIVGFALAPSLSMAAIMLGLFGAFQSCYMSLNSTMLMGNTDPKLYGRVLSVNLMTFSVTPLAALPLAWAADHVDPRMAVLTSGILVAVALGIAAIVNPTTRRAG